ncbi:MAG: hypothetical protein PF442_03040 [Desulfobulbaceae bacterium]|jgi:hypothetical protein|nr:hypothetical protein [Desulfobulbaceae bacterium]
MQDETKTSPFVFSIGICSLILVLIFSYFLVEIVVDYGSRLEKEKLLHRAITAASSFQPELVASLSAEPTDTNNPNIKAVRSQLLRMKKANSDSRFVYLMAKQVDNIVFLADAESPDSEDYSKSGDVYAEASPRLHAIFNNGKPFTEGPFEDKWGIWVSGHAPIIDPETNKVIAIIGIDIDANNWQVLFLFPDPGNNRYGPRFSCILCWDPSTMDYSWTIRTHPSRRG